MRYEIVVAPITCGHRDDVSEHPGGDYRCGKNGIKCCSEDVFPDECPLLVLEIPKREK